MGVVTLKNVRTSYLHLFDKHAFDAKSVPKFEGSFLIPKNSELDKMIRAEISKVAKEAWGDKAKVKLDEFKVQPQRYCYTDGDNKESPEFAGHMVIKGKNKNRPAVVDRNPQIHLTAEDGRLYSGCYVVANLDIWAQTKPAANAGIRCTLRGVQFYRDGDAFSGGAPASADEFEDLSEGVDVGLGGELEGAGDLT